MFGSGIPEVERGGFAQANDGGNIFRAGAEAPLLSAAGELRLQPDALADIDGAHALGGVDLMAGEGKHINVHGLHIDGHMTVGLNGVGMEHNALFMTDPAQLRHGIDGADLVVGKHDGDQRGVRPDRLLQRLRLYLAILVHRQIGDLKALLFQRLGGVKNGVVLDGGDDEMLLALSLTGMEIAPQRQIVGFAAAAGEGDLRGVGVHQQRHLLPGVFQRLVAALAQPVEGAGVAVFRGKEGHHFIQDIGVDGGGRRVVRIDKTIFHGVVLLLSAGLGPVLLISGIIYTFLVAFTSGKCKFFREFSGFSAENRPVPPDLPPLPPAAAAAFRPAQKSGRRRTPRGGRRHLKDKARTLRKGRPGRPGRRYRPPSGTAALRPGRPDG